LVLNIVRKSALNAEVVDDIIRFSLRGDRNKGARNTPYATDLLALLEQPSIALVKAHRAARVGAIVVRFSGAFLITQLDQHNVVAIVPTASLSELLIRTNKAMATFDADYQALLNQEQSLRYSAGCYQATGHEALTSIVDHATERLMNTDLSVVH